MSTEKVNQRMTVDLLSASRQADAAPQLIMSEALFGGQRELVISHMGQVYRLRQTQQGKLILTK